MPVGFAFRPQITNTRTFRILPGHFRRKYFLAGDADCCFGKHPISETCSQIGSKRQLLA